MADSFEDLVNKVQARQQEQQAQVLPTERQPPMPGLADPQSDALQTPLVSPEEVIAGGVAGPLASAVTEGAPLLARGAGQLLTDEAGTVPLSGGRLQPLQRVQQALGHSVTPAGEVLNIAQAKALAADAQAAAAAGKLSIDDLARVQQHLGRSVNRGYAEGGEVAPDDAAGSVTGISDVPASIAPAAVNVLNPEGQLVSIPQEHLQTALDSGYSHADPAAVEAHFTQEKYGTAGQQAIAGLEGVAQGVAGPLATGIERIAGVPAEDIRGREEANPYTHGVGELAGFTGSAVLGTGEARLLGEAGTAVGAATGLGKAGSGFIEQVGADAVKAAFETALYQGGDELARKFKEDPEQTAGSAISHIGMAGVMGGVFGGALGAALRKTGVVGAEVAEPASKFVSELDHPKLQAGDFETTVTHAENLTPTQKKGIFSGLKERKSNADAIEGFAEENNLPVHPGMISASKDVQKVTSGLVEGPPTLSGQATKAIYDEGYKGASGIIEGTLGEGSQLSKAEIGNSFKDTLAAQIKEENAPIRAAYEELATTHGVVPLSQEVAPRIAKELEHIPELKITPNSPQGKLVSATLSNLENVKTVGDLRTLKSSLYDGLSPTASSGEKRMAAVISDKLKALEEESIVEYARKMATTPEEAAAALGLKDARKAADAQYKPFIEKIQKLSKALGKGRVHGPQDAMHFISELTPEQVTTRLFTKNNSQFLKFFEREFPEQASLMREYQKGVLREAATKEGILSPARLFTSIDKLEPEIQRAIFTEAELSRLAGAKTYLESFPKNYNSSNTSNMSALRDFFTSPVKTASANARDFGMDQFVKRFGASPRAQQAAELGRATVSGDKMANTAVKAVLSPEKDLPANLTPTEAQRSKLSKLVDSMRSDPSKMLQAGDSNPVPAYAQAFSTMAARAVTYLSSIKPDTAPRAPLDTKHAASSFQQSTYNRALDIVQQPLHVLARVKQGTLTQQDVITLKTVYPGVYQSLSQKLMNSVIESADKGQPIAYKTRLQLSMFLGQPLDSTMTQPAMAAMQAKPSAQQQQPATPTAPASGPKRSTAKLGKIATAAQTPGQARLADRSDGKL